VGVFLDNMGAGGSRAFGARIGIGGGLRLCVNYRAGVNTKDMSAQVGIPILVDVLYPNMGNSSKTVCVSLCSTR